MVLRGLSLLVSIPLALSFVSAANDVASPTPGFLFVANQFDHTALIIDLAQHKSIAAIEVGINGHEVAVSPDKHFAYVPIYGNAGVGKPGTDGSTIDIIDLHERKIAGTIDLGKPVRPHCAKFGPGGLLYVTAELANSVHVVDTNARKVVAQIPTGAIESHMLVISPDGHRAYTANVHAGSVSVLDLDKRALITVIPVANLIQRISISPDGKRVFTHDQEQPRIAVIDTATNKIANWIPLPASVYSSVVLPGGSAMLANSTSGKLFFVDLSQNKVTRETEVPPSMGAIALTPDNHLAYLTCPQAGTIEVIDTQTGAKSAPITLTKGVDGVEWLDSVR